MKPLVYYHRDSDGICAALVVQEFLGRIEAVSVQYGEEPPAIEDVAGRIVWILDFSYPRDVLEAMNEAAESLVVLDHHKTAAAELEGLDYARFDMDQSGASLTLDYVVNVTEREIDLARHAALSILVEYVEDRDLWKWKLQGSKAMNAWIASFPLHLDAWTAMLDYIEEERGIVSCLIEGAAILRRTEQLVAQLTYKATDAILSDGSKRTCKLINTPLFQSEVGNALADSADFVCCWCCLPDGSMLYSLRSGPDGADVSEIAKENGGGGHARAAGFKSFEMPGAYFEPVEEDE